MSKDPSQVEIQCAFCGFVDSGRFCSNCGKELSSRRQSFLLEVLPQILRLDEILSHLRLFFTILRSPTRATIRLIEDPTFHGHLGFLITSVGLLVLVYGYLISVSGIPVSQQLFLGTIQWLFLSLGIYLTYLLLSRASQYVSSFAEYFKVVCLIYGFVLPFAALLAVLGGYLGLTGEGRIVGRYVLAIPVAIYQVRVLSHYWNLSKLRVLWYWWLGGMISLMIILSLWFVLSWVFQINLSMLY